MSATASEGSCQSGPSYLSSSSQSATTPSHGLIEAPSNFRSWYVHPQKCNRDPNAQQLARWVGIEVVSLVIEILILALATYIILMLQMPMKAKFKGIFAFLTRLP